MKSIPGKINSIGFQKLIWILAASETLHNFEEALWLPSWSRTLTIRHPSVGEFEFRFAIGLLTFLIYIILYYCAKTDNPFSKYLLGGMLIMILLNVFIPHVAASILTGHLVPGVVSGVLLNIPVTVYLLWKGLEKGFFNKRILIIGGVGFGIITMPLLMLCFKLGGLIKQLAFIL
jgi:hypothetical protein